MPLGTLVEKVRSVDLHTENCVSPLAICNALGFDAAVTNAEASFAMAATLTILALGDLVNCKPFCGIGPVAFGEKMSHTHVPL